MSASPSSGCCCGGAGGENNGESCPGGDKCVTVTDTCCWYETSPDPHVELGCPGADPLVITMKGGPGSTIALSLNLIHQMRWTQWVPIGGGGAEPFVLDPWADANGCGAAHPQATQDEWTSYNFVYEKTVVQFGATMRWKPKNAALCTDWGWWSRQLVRLGTAATPDIDPATVTPGPGAVGLHSQCDSTQLHECDIRLTTGPGEPGSFTVTIRRTDGGDIALGNSTPSAPGWAVSSPGLWTIDGHGDSRIYYDILDAGFGTQKYLSITFVSGETVEEGCITHWYQDAPINFTITEDNLTDEVDNKIAVQVRTVFNGARGPITLTPHADCPYTCSPEYLVSSLCECGEVEGSPRIYFTLTVNRATFYCDDNAAACSQTHTVTGYYSVCDGFAATITGCVYSGSGSEPSNCGDECGSGFDGPFMEGMGPACVTVDGESRFIFRIESFVYGSGSTYYDLKDGCPDAVQLQETFDIDDCGVGEDPVYGTETWTLVLG